jgi:AraC-like DNA-binding protein
VREKRSVAPQRRAPLTRQNQVVSALSRRHTEAGLTGLCRTKLIATEMLGVSDRMPLANRQLFATQDAIAARMHLSARFWPHTLRFPGRADALVFRHNVATIADLSVNALRYGTDVIIDSQPTDSSYLVKFTLGGASDTYQDDALARSTAGMVCVMNPTRRLRVRLSADHNQLTLRVPGPTLARYVEREIGVHLNTPLEFFAVARSVADCAPGLGRLVETICADADADHGGFDIAHVARHLEHTLIGLLLSELPHNYSTRLATLEAESAAPAYVRRAEDYLAEHAARDVTLDDVVAAVGVSVRALQNGFRRYRRTTPMQFLRDRRLARARAALLADDASSRGVAAIAFDSGFSDVSRFARYYRERYGETPSQTLRQR